MMVWQGKHCLPSWHVLSSGHLFVLFFFSSRQRLVSLVLFVPGIPLGSLCVALRFPQMGHLHRNCWSEGTFRIPCKPQAIRHFVVVLRSCAHFVLGCLSFLLETHHGRCSLQAQDFAPEKAVNTVPCQNVLTGFGTCWRSLVSLAGFSDTAISGHGRS